MTANSTETRPSPGTGGGHAFNATYSDSLGNLSGSGTGTLAVGQTHPEFTGLTSQTITYGIASVLVSGTLNAGAYARRGSSDRQRRHGSASTTATIQNNGSFSATLITSGLSASTTTYAITCSYAGDQNFTATNDSSSALTVNPATVDGVRHHRQQQGLRLHDDGDVEHEQRGLGGLFSGDTVTLSTSGATGTFASKDVANGITVTVVRSDPRRRAGGRLHADAADDDGEHHAGDADGVGHHGQQQGLRRHDDGDAEHGRRGVARRVQRRHGDAEHQRCHRHVRPQGRGQRHHGHVSGLDDSGGTAASERLHADAADDDGEHHAVRR